MSHVVTMQEYIRQLRDTYLAFPVDEVDKAVTILWDAYQENKNVVAFGNGGSGLIAAHLIQDLAKHVVSTDSKRDILPLPRFKALCLNECASTMTAWANDMGYEDTYAQMAINWIGEGDVLVTVSSSGTSKNVLKAMDVTKTRGGKNITFVGHSGGLVKGLADACIWVPTDNNYHAEDIFGSAVHLICDILRSQIQGRS